MTPAILKALHDSNDPELESLIKSMAQRSSDSLAIEGLKVSPEEFEEQFKITLQKIISGEIKL